MTMYDRIRELRIKAGMTQDDLAKAMGYKDRSMITKIEGGKVDISQKKVNEFAKALCTTPGYLMGWVEPADNGYPEADFSMPKTEEAKIISSKVDRLTEAQRKKLLNIVNDMFDAFFEDR